MIALDFPTAWAANADEYVHKGLAVHDQFKGEALITTTFAPHAAYSVGDATLKRIRQLADELDVPIHMHLHETAAEVEAALAATGQRPLARLAALGLVTPALIGVHATVLAPDEIDLLAAAGASVVHCPRANLKLASGACPVAALARAGVNVALGTDGAAGNNRLDLWSEIGTAALLAKHVAADASALPASAAIELATINGARALNLAGEIGSLVAGKAADLVCVDLSRPALRPVLDPLSQLVYAAERSDVSDVWVAGEHLLAGGELVRLDVDAIAATADEWAARLARE
jgi:5-methylthioadenosine/S-adenosylhomocysteine deaminase